MSFYKEPPMGPADGAALASKKLWRSTQKCPCAINETKN